MTLSTGGLGGVNFVAELGYTVSGTVSYSGVQTGRVYVLLNNNCGASELSTSILAPGSFTIHGAAPGNYSLTASMDPQGYGYPNVSFPSGTTTGVSIYDSSPTGQTITLADPSPYTLSTGPTLDAISPMDEGVLVHIPLLVGTVNGHDTELATSYQIEWSTSLPFTSPTSSTSYTFEAGSASGTDVVILNNYTSGISSGTFNNGTAYYFRARGAAGSNYGPWTVYGGSTTPTAVTIGAPTGGNTVSGNVTFSGTATGPLYVGFFDMSTGNAYGTRIASPVSPQAYTVQVPNGSNYFLFGVVDQNNDGLIEPGDISNTRENTVVSAPSSNEDLTLPDINSTAAVTTHVLKNSTPANTFMGYGLGFDVRSSNKEVVAAQLTSGPNVMNPIDFGKCTYCGNVQFQYALGLGSIAPSVGDTYALQVPYSDGTSETLNPSVNTVLSAFATSLMPQQTTFGVSTTPTFSWNYPASASSYTYRFQLFDNNGNLIWQIPGQNSQSNGFTSSQIPSASGGSGIVWPTDPTDGSNAPTVTTLTSGTQYNWSIETTDSNGNTATRMIWFRP